MSFTNKDAYYYYIIVITSHYIANRIALRHIALRYITLHYNAFHCITLGLV